MPFSSMSGTALRATVGATFSTSTGSVSLPQWVSSSATVTADGAGVARGVVAGRQAVIQVLVLDREADLAGDQVDGGDREHGPIGPESNVSFTASVSTPAASRVARIGEHRVGAVVGIVPVDGQRMAIQQADVGVAAAERGRAVLVDSGTASAGPRWEPRS